MTRFLHGRDIFDILVNKQTGEVIYDKFRRLGFLLGIPETIILCMYIPRTSYAILSVYRTAARLWDYKLNAFSTFDLDSFMLYYFDLLSTVDNWIKQKDTKESDAKTKPPRCAVS